MGLSASQARLLSLTARLSDLELRAQSISNAKIRLSDMSADASKAYSDALNKETMKVYSGVATDGNATYEDANAYNLTTYGAISDTDKQRFIKDSAGKLIVSDKVGNAYKNSNSNTETFLENLGYSSFSPSQQKSMNESTLLAGVTSAVATPDNSVSSHVDTSYVQKSRQVPVYTTTPEAVYTTISVPSSTTTTAIPVSTTTTQVPIGTTTTQIPIGTTTTQIPIGTTTTQVPTGTTTTQVPIGTTTTQVPTGTTTTQVPIGTTTTQVPIGTTTTQVPTGTTTTQVPIGTTTTQVQNGTTINYVAATYIGTIQNLKADAITTVNAFASNANDTTLAAVQYAANELQGEISGFGSASGYGNNATAAQKAVIQTQLDAANNYVTTVYSSYLRPQNAANLINMISLINTDALTAAFTTPTYTNYVTTQYGDNVTTQYGPDVTTQYGPDVTTQYGPDVTTQYGPDVTTQYGPDVTTQYGPDVTTQYGPDVTTQYGPDVTTQYGPDVTTQYVSQVSTNYTDEVTTNYVDNVSTSYATEYYQDPVYTTVFTSSLTTDQMVADLQKTEDSLTALSNLFSGNDLNAYISTKNSVLAGLITQLQGSGSQTIGSDLSASIKNALDGISTDEIKNLLEKGNFANPYSNDQSAVAYYINVFNEITKNGYNPQSDKVMKSSEWLQSQINGGNIYLYEYNSTAGSAGTGAFTNVSWTSGDSTLQETTDSTQTAKAEAEYDTKMAAIQSKDKRFDQELSSIDTEHTATQTEVDSVKKVIDKNIERGFKMFDA